MVSSYGWGRDVVMEEVLLVFKKYLSVNKLILKVVLSGEFGCFYTFCFRSIWILVYDLFVFIFRKYFRSIYVC